MPLDDDPAPAAAWPAPIAPNRRSLAVRLFAFTLLLGVTSLFIDYRGLVRDAGRSLAPRDLATIPIRVDALGPGTTVAERAVYRDARSQTLDLVLRRPADPFSPADAGAVEVALLDAAGAEIGRQTAAVEVSADGAAHLALTFFGAVRPERLAVRPMATAPR